MKRKKKKTTHTHTHTKKESEYLAEILERMCAKPQLGSHSQLSTGFPTGLLPAHSSHQEDGSFQPGFGFKREKKKTKQESASFIQDCTKECLHQWHPEPTLVLSQLAAEDIADVVSQGARCPQWWSGVGFFLSLSFYVVKMLLGSLHCISDTLRLLIIYTEWEKCCLNFHLTKKMLWREK